MAIFSYHKIRSFIIWSHIATLHFPMKMRTDYTDVYFIFFFLRYSAKLPPFHYANQRTLRDKWFTPAFSGYMFLSWILRSVKKKKQKTKKGFPTFLYWRKKITKFKNRWKGYKTYVLYRHALLSLYTLWFMINRAMPFRKIIWYHLIILWIF